MLIRMVVTVVLMFWASDSGKALTPAGVFAGISLGFGLMVNAGGQGAGIGSVLFQTGIDFASAFVLFFLVTRTGGLIGWLVRGLTVLVLGGMASLLLKLF